MQATDRTSQTQPTRRHWPDRTAHRHRKLARKAFVVVAVLLVVLPWLGYRQLQEALVDTAPGAVGRSVGVAPPAAPPPSEAKPAAPGATAPPTAAAPKQPGAASIAGGMAGPVPASDARPALAGSGNVFARETARADIQSIAGVRAAGWLDRERLLVVVERNDLRTEAMIGTVCSRLASGADAAGVTVQLQSAAAVSPAELEPIGRRCQGPDEAVRLVARPIDDGLDALRTQVQRDSETAAGDAARSERNAESMRILEESTPQL